MTFLSRSVFLIVGGTSGIGLHTAQRLSQKNKVFIAGRREIFEPRCDFLAMDVLEEESICQAFEELENRSGSLDGIVYSAGIAAPRQSITELQVRDWERVFHTNVTGAMLCLKYGYPLLKKSQGKVVLVNSIAARDYSLFSGIQYTTSKAALTGLARQAAAEWAHDGILVNSIYPSMTRTPMLEKNVPQNKIDDIESEIPLRRIASQDEIAAAIEFLLSGENTYMTGCGIDLNGGQYFN